MEERTRRIGENEALFREVNERVRAVNESFSVASQAGDFVCECGDTSCLERVTVPLQDYERVRGDSALFIVRPGHDLPDVETVVEAHEGWHVVRKNPGAAERVAVATDPRA